MTRGKPWTVDEETTLKALVEANTPLDAIAIKLKKKPDGIYVKCLRLGLTQKPHNNPSNVPLPKELISVEEALKKLATALETVSTPGLDRLKFKDSKL